MRTIRPSLNHKQGGKEVRTKAKYLQPHRKLFLAWQKGKGVRISKDELEALFNDHAILQAATQKYRDGRAVGEDFE